MKTCCDNELVAKDPENSGTSTGCCTLNDGSKVQYDVFVSFCCNGMVDDKPYGVSKDKLDAILL